MDLEAESIVSIDTGMSSDIAESCNKLLDIQKKISTAEEEMKKLKEVETTLSEQTIPNLMQQAGISMLKLADGSSVEVKPFYSARIPASKSEEAFNWLSNNGHGDIIKNTVTVSFGRKENDSALKLADELAGQGLDPTQKKWVEPMTLKAFVREQVENGNDLPLETFNVYIGQKTRIIKK